jgi:multisubunit Na+/H+ antiporter MnhG subunit
MIYHLSLHTAGVLAGAFLVVVGVLGLMKPDFAQVVKQFPRSRFAGVVLLPFAWLGPMWLLATIQMGEVAGFVDLF